MIQREQNFRLSWSLENNHKNFLEACSLPNNSSFVLFGCTVCIIYEVLSILSTNTDYNETINCYLLISLTTLLLEEMQESWELQTDGICLKFILHVSKITANLGSKMIAISSSFRVLLCCLYVKQCRHTKTLTYCFDKMKDSFLKWLI